MPVMNRLIVIVDDEPDIRELVSHHLKKSGFRVKEFSDAAKMYKFINIENPDLIILDLMLPDSNGLDVCKKLKMEEKTSSIPIIMLTAKDEETDKVLGLELGADDYVTKPFSVKELVARVRVALRKSSTIQNTDIIVVGGILRIDSKKYEVHVENKEIAVTTTEFRIIQLLTSKKGWVFSREQILDYLWGDEKAILDRTIDVHIKNLREKLGKAGNFIKNIRGIGYKLEE